MRVPQPGDQFGRYRIDQQLGQDGVGVAFAATDPRLQRTVTLTVVRPEVAGRPGFAEAFRAAGARLSSLSSPYVVQLHDHDADGEQPYVVSQHVAGGDLAAWLQQHGAMPQRAALVLAEQVAAGLADAHRHGVVHGDLGPHTVLVRDAGTDRAHAWLTGFPLTGAAPDATADGDLRGVGRALLAALTGADPGPAVAAPAPGTYGRGIDELLGRLLGPDPAARPADAGALRAELADLVARFTAPAAPPTAVRPALPPTAPPSAPPPAAPPTYVAGQAAPPAYPPPAAPPAAPARSRRGLVLGLVAAVVLLLVAGGIGWTVLSDDDTSDKGGTDTAEPTVTGDLDGDGRGDVLLDRIETELLHSLGESVLLPSGTDGVGDPVTEIYPDDVALDNNPELQLADVDGDGLQDRVYTTSVDVSLVIDVVPAEGEPWHQEIRADTTPWGAADFVAALLGDMNQDGKADLVVYDESLTSGFAVFVGVAEDGTFAEPEPWYTSDSNADIAQLDIGDFDGDGNHDILATLEGDNNPEEEWAIELQVITSDGSALADAGEPRPIDADRYSQGVRLWGDLDGDGDDQPLLVGPDGFATVDMKEEAAQEVTQVWTAAPDNRAWQQRYARYSSSATAAWVISDVDGDGDDDLVFFKFRGDADSRPVTVRLAEDGELAPPAPWGSFDCRPNCDDGFEPVTPAY